MGHLHVVKCICRISLQFMFIKILYSPWSLENCGMLAPACSQMPSHALGASWGCLHQVQGSTSLPSWRSCSLASSTCAPVPGTRVLHISLTGLAIFVYILCSIRNQWRFSFSNKDSPSSSFFFLPSENE